MKYNLNTARIIPPILNLHQQTPKKQQPNHNPNQQNQNPRTQHQHKPQSQIITEKQQGLR